MRAWFYRLLGFLLAVAIAALIGCISATQFVLAGLGATGIDIPAGDRVLMTLKDILGMAPMLFLVYGVTLLVGFCAAGLCRRVLPGSRQAWFTLAGAVATVSVLLLMQRLMGGMPIAGARGFLGLSGQAIAGAAAGYVFARVVKFPREARA